nr:hypothetical protein [Cyanobium sp. A1C-AMD]
MTRQSGSHMRLTRLLPNGRAATPHHPRP